MEDVGKNKERAVYAMERFLRVLRKVPEDKMTWSPSPTAKSPLQIAAHCAAYSIAFPVVIRTRAFPGTVEEWRAPIDERIASVQTVEQAEAMLRQGIADTLSALDTVTPEMSEVEIDTVGSKTPFSFFMRIPHLHLYGHTYQLDYLQTCWDDQEVHL